MYRFRFDNLKGSLVAFSLVSLAGATAEAAVIRVTTPDGGMANDGYCSLAEAILAANTNARQFGCPSGSGDDTIEIAAGGWVNLSLGSVLTVTSNITIQTVGSAYNRATIHGGSGNFSVAPKGKLTLSHLRITGFRGVTAIELEDGTSSTNRAELYLNRTEMFGNIAHENAQSVNLVVKKAALATIYQSVIRNNESIKGGALLVAGGQVYVNRSVLADNRASQYGGAIHMMSRGGYSPFLSVIASTIANNHATAYDGGAVYASDAYAGIYYSTITGNTAGRDGDAIYATSSSSGEITLHSNIISDNGIPQDDGDCQIGGSSNFYSAGANLLRNCTGFSKSSDVLLDRFTALGLNAMPATPALWVYPPEMVPNWNSPAVHPVNASCNSSSEASYDQGYTFRLADNVCATGAVDP